MAAQPCRRAFSSNLVGPPVEFLRAAAAVTAGPPVSAPKKLPPMKRLTENASPTFVSSGDPCLDFFLHVVPGTPATRVASLLADAWAADPNTALRLACNLVGLGYLKVLPEILYRIVKGVDTTRRPGKKAEVRVTGAAMGFRRLGKEECAAAFKELERKIERRWSSDMQKLGDGKLNEISLAGKWRPSLNCRHDPSTLLSEAIARRLFPKGSEPDLPEEMPDEHYVYQVRNRLRKALVPLRRALQLPEVFITAQAWGDVVYSRVASRAMRRYRKLFLKHDAERFELYLADVEAGKAKIAAGALRPHEILASMDGDGVAELQWECVAVFDKLLSVAVGGNLPPERMVRKVFVFSDMEFDQASSRPWETDYEAITRKFTEAGYGAVVPQIVFGNLRDSMSVPVTAGQKGVAMGSGFSKNLVKLFLDNDGILTPRAIMEKAISGQEYQNLIVYD
ncbi:unnamed protein product [Miscanthus lutarioriparius]|uniref:Uncharacterized protein n=1 Tax=Miscanthus lutarioriparius TaxID=422564 RepID=A0A811SC28_9POAL|nr:unnamed protein product [Miscanthus lutarioriparius]